MLATAAAVLAFGLALANLRQLTSELGRVWLIAGAAWFFFLRAGPLTERLARSTARAALSFLALRLADAVRRRRCWSRAMFVTRDMGPLLIAGYASGAFLAAARRDVVASAQRPASIGAFALALAAVRGWIGAVTFALFSVGAHDSVTASRARERRRAVRVDQRPARAGAVVPARRARRRASASARCRGAAYAPARGCSGVPAQIHSDYTFTAIVGVFGPLRRLGGVAGDARSGCIA